MYLLGFVLIATLLAGGIWWAQKDLKKSMAFAKKQGWNYAVNNRASNAPSIRLYNIFPFNKNWSKYLITSIFWGETTSNLPFRAFKYVPYKGGSNLNTKAQKRQAPYGIVMVRVENYNFPEVNVQPENVLTKVQGAVFGDHDLEDAQFNNRFRISSKNPNFATTLIHPQMMEALSLNNLNYNIVFIGDGIVALRNYTFKKEEIPVVLDQLNQIASQIPHILKGDNS